MHYCRTDASRKKDVHALVEIVSKCMTKVVSVNVDEDVKLIENANEHISCLSKWTKKVICWKKRFNTKLDEETVKHNKNQEAMRTEKKVDNTGNEKDNWIRPKNHVKFNKNETHKNAWS